jgi:cytochrome b561
MIINSPSRFGSLTILLHWSIALIIVGEFALGLYMTDLDYHHPLYQALPEFHESMGLLLGVLVLIRIVWSLISVHPSPESGVGPLELRVSRLVQTLMNLLAIGIVVFGYLLSTASGDEILVFDQFSVPAMVTVMENQEDLSIFLHKWLAWTVIGFACLHTLGALKHHFFDRDETLRRMLGLKPRA